MSFRVNRAGSAALAALRAGPATVFASFERSCYVETQSGIACLGGPGVGMGPLNAIVEDFESFSLGRSVFIDIEKTGLWKPCASLSTEIAPEIEIPSSIAKPARAFLAWLRNEGKSPDELIGLGPGLTPSGDDFVGGAMIALRASGKTGLANRVAAWALPLARDRTNRISRAHLECAAQGEGHEALHDLLCSFDRKHLERLARIGHSSGMDAAAGALLALA